MNLSGCKLLSDAGVIPIVQSCRQIQVLNLTRLVNISDDSIKVVAECLSELRELYLYADAQLSDEAFKHLANSELSK